MCKTVKEVVLRNSGLTLDEFDDAFFNEAANSNLPIKNLDEAAEVILEEAYAGTNIHIIGDYDVDGVSGTSVIYLALKEITENVDYRIPKRMSEGYGLKDSIVDEFDDGLLITVDNGITAYEAVKKAKEKGMKVVIVDHHLLGENQLPPADVIVDPHVINEGEDDFKDYCGCGLAFRLACKLIPGHPILEKLLCYAAIGTIADAVPLRRENRFIVKRGLMNMVQKDKRTLGLGALLAVYNLNQYVNEKDIAFRIAPAINAAGRLYDDGAKIPLELLISKASFDDCLKKANELYEVNRLRIKMKDEQIEIARDIIKRDMLFNTAPIVIASKKFHEGLAGIIAGKLAEEYHVPAIVLAELEDGATYKGSGRSVEDVNLYELIKTHEGLLSRFGGHPMACGLSMKKENFNEFACRLEDEMIDYEPLAAVGNVKYDLVIQGTEVDEVMNEVRKYAPYGEGNPEIVFKIENYRLSPKGSSVYETKGEDNSTILLNGMNSSAIGFFMTADYMREGQPQNLTIIGTIRDKYKVPMFKRDNNYVPKSTPTTRSNKPRKPIERETQVEIIDMKKMDMPVKRTSLAEMLMQQSMNRR